MSATLSSCGTGIPACAAYLPAPPATAPARQRYWDDTVMEAVGELRRRLNSSRESVVTLALLSILEVEKTRMRTGRSLSGTQVSHVREDDGSLPKLGPLEEDVPFVPKSTTGKPNPGLTAGDEKKTVPTAQVSEQATPQPTTVRPTRERGTLADADQPITVETPEAHGARSRVELTAAPAPVVARSSASGCETRPLAERATTPEPHPAFQLWLVSQLGTGDDTLPVGVT